MSTSRSQSRLFSRACLQATIQERLALIPKRVARISEQVLRLRIDSSLGLELAEEIAFKPLALEIHRASLTRKEVEIENLHYSKEFGATPVKRKEPAVRTIVSIPFNGSQELWHLEPSTPRIAPFGSTRPSPNMESGYLDLEFEQTIREAPESLGIKVQSRIQVIQEYLMSQSNALSHFFENAKHESVISLQARRKLLDNSVKSLELLRLSELAAVQQNCERYVYDTSPARMAPREPQSRDHLGWDVFVSHASEDKIAFVRPLVQLLTAAGLMVWYDEATLRLGDSLRRKIDEGLSNSRFGIVVLSKAFFAKEWPQRELDALVALESGAQRTVLPIWHNVSVAEVQRFSPILADRLAVHSSEGAHAIAQKILGVVKPDMEPLLRST